MYRLSILSAAALVLVLAMVGACEGLSERPSTETSPEPATAPGIQVSEVRVASEEAAEPGGGEDADRLLAAETVYVLVWVTGDGNGEAAEVDVAVRRRPDDTVVEERVRSVQAPRNRQVVFELTQPGGWQSGEYVAAVTVDGQEAMERRFEIAPPTADTPASPAGSPDPRPARGAPDP